MRILQWLRNHVWVAFLLHQFVIIAIAIAFLTLVRRLTSKTIHLGQDPIGIADGLALGFLSVAVILLTNWFYRLLKGPDSPPLGIDLSIRRLLHLSAGSLIGAIFFAAPFVISTWLGTASVVDTIGAHFDTVSIVVIIAASLLMLLLQAAMEETANRAFPMRIWEHRSIFFKLLVPAFFFVAVHLVSETFDSQRAATLLAAGIVHGLAYALTGNIWFTTGLHWGANVAAFSMSGLWYAGAIVNVSGTPIVPVWSMAVLMILILGAILAIRTGVRPAAS